MFAEPFFISKRGLASEKRAQARMLEPHLFSSFVVVIPENPFTQIGHADWVASAGTVPEAAC